jgi:Na+/H+ antiporter NhaA
MATATGRTAWRRRASPLKRFLATETGGAAVLVLAVVVALFWVNVSATTYRIVWQTPLSVSVGDVGVSLSLRGWINSGLMAFFFFVVGLEARREFDLGELRQRRRVALPLLAGLGGMLAPILLFLAINAGRPSAHAWGAVMTTDTALTLGVLALAGRRLPGRLRVFLLTVTVVDDIVGIVVIATVYSESVNLSAMLIAAALFAAVLLVRTLRIHIGLIYLALAVGCWLAVLKSGVDPIVVGLAMGLIAYAYPAGRSDLERASDLFRRFREQPTPQLARAARTGVRLALSPNDRLQAVYHPWTSYVIVPLFALANAGVPITGEALRRAFTSPVTIGILVGYLLGKPVGIAFLTGAVSLLSRGRVRPPVGWASVLGAGTAASIGFTVSVLIADIALRGDQLDDAKIGIFASLPGAALTTWTLTWILGRLPRRLRIRAVYGTANAIIDLTVPVDPDRDHIRGPASSPVTVVEYGDFECPYCGRAEPIVRQLLARFGDVRYVWRHLPLTDVHPHAQLAAEAAEAAHAQGAFWAMHDILLNRQDALRPDDLIRYAGELGLDVERFQQDLTERRGANQIAADIDSADLSNVSGTPTFFINERRHYGAYDIDNLSAAVKTARIQASVGLATASNPHGKNE